MYSKLQLFVLGGLVCGVYALAVYLFLYNLEFFLVVGLFCTVYFFVVVFLVLIFNFIGVAFRDL